MDCEKWATLGISKMWVVGLIPIQILWTILKDIGQTHWLSASGASYLPFLKSYRLIDFNTMLVSMYDCSGSRSPIADNCDWLSSSLNRLGASDSFLCCGESSLHGSRLLIESSTTDARSSSRKHYTGLIWLTDWIDKSKPLLPLNVIFIC